MYDEKSIRVAKTLPSGLRNVEHMSTRTQSLPASLCIRLKSERRSISCLTGSCHYSNLLVVFQSDECKFGVLSPDSGTGRSKCWVTG